MHRMYSILAGALVLASLAAPMEAQQAVDSAGIKARQRLEAILGIPRRADEIRRAGVPDSTVRSVLDILVKEKVPAQDAAVILQSERDAAAEHGPTDNFGAFVQSQLAAGKRGQDLAAAIRAEHQARGKGRPANAGRGNDADEKRGGRPEAAERGGRPEEAMRGGRPEAGGRGARPDEAATRGKRPDSTAGKRPPKKPF